ncbi:dihydrofolate reductase [Kribbella sandramycini]|uniref:Dihydrofolate reductase n=1 Tax=Kribbella sandramycini TaxID=60450 RepID=A0A7Y4L2V2_9ACTN|nr:dihydrofolate reductase family protein [Kribbella sandramycini]MBB6564492.1 dihydrofolate reductase [Kribbella sandramycini]NOL42196.1 dihydrofolate reductase [Kribbella sandramycini]
MSSVVVDISVSLDGYVTGPNAGLTNGLGDGGLALHDWVFHGTDADRAILDASFAQTGAVIQGRNLFDIIDGPEGWSDDMGYGAKPTGEVNAPIFVVTHSAPEKTRLGDRFHFVDSPAEAVAQARAAAGDQDVVVMGGGDICHQMLATGLADVLRLHVTPVVLGNGTRLFPAEPSAAVTLTLTDAVSTPSAQHLTYAVVRHG